MNLKLSFSLFFCGILALSVGLFYLNVPYWYLISLFLIIVFFFSLRYFLKQNIIRPQKLTDINKIANGIIKLLGKENILNLDHDERTITIKITSNLDVDLEKIRSCGIAGVLKLDLETLKLISRDDTLKLYEEINKLL